MHRELTLIHRTSILREALDILEAEYASDLSLNEVAHRIATSRRQLQRCFEEHSDMSFREHLTAIRMNRAAELLVHTSDTVRSIAARVGYRQPAQFAKSFRARYGHGPLEYRAAHRQRGRELAATAA